MYHAKSQTRENPAKRVESPRAGASEGGEDLSEGGYRTHRGCRRQVPHPPGEVPVPRARSPGSPHRAARLSRVAIAPGCNRGRRV